MRAPKTRSSAIASFIAVIFMIGFSASAWAQTEILSFYAPGCPNCQKMENSLRPLISQGETVRGIDAIANVDLRQQWKVDQVPTLILVKDGREVRRVVGYFPYRELLERLEIAAPPTVRGQSPTNPAASPSGAPQSLNPFPMLGSSSSSSATQSISDQPVNLNQPDGFQSNQIAPNQIAPSQLAPSRQARPMPETRITDMDNAVIPASATAPLQQPPPGQYDRSAVNPRLVAQMATVRIRIDDPKSQAHGTGTIVDQQGEDILILTCGHLFRDLTPEAEIWVELFVGGTITKVRASLIDFQADKADIGVITCKPGVRVQPVRVAPSGSKLALQQPVFSWGCDKGADPSLRDTEIISINRYLHSPNVEIRGAPVVGRSGGGLFDETGALIGVCNYADSQEDEGIYAGPELLHWQLNRLGLARLFNTPIESSLASAAPVSATANPTAAAAIPTAAIPAAAAPAMATSAPRELVMIVRDANQQEQTITIKQPTEEQLRWVEQQANSANALRR